MTFIRPWFLLMAAILLVFLIFKKHLSSQNPLERFVDKRLLPFLTVHFNIDLYRLKMHWFIFFWLICTLAGAGPAFEKISVPASTQAPATVIVMDMSQAMSGDNLTKAKLKLYDLLNTLKGGQVGLVLYDEKGYTAAPLTQDTDVIQNMISSLSPAVMPRPLNRPATGFKQAAELLKNAQINKGQIVFITAGGFDEAGLEQIARSLPHQIITLAIETDNIGYPVPIAGGDFMRHADGTVVLVKPNADILSKIGTYVPMTVSDSDIQKIATLTPAPQANETSDIATSASMWKDLGPYLLLISSAFFIWVFRKGVFFILCITLPFGANAGLFERTDQEIYRKTMAGVTAYQQGNYEAARQVFENGKTANDFYNAGNAKAHLNDIQGAIKSYDNALKLNPNHAEAAWNKTYLEKQLPPKQQSQNNHQNQQSDSSNQQSSENQSETSSDNQENTLPDQGQNSAADTQKEAQNSNQNQAPAEQSTDDTPPPPKNSAQSAEPQQPEAQAIPEETDPTDALKNTQEPPRPSEEPAENNAQEESQIKNFDQDSKQLLNKIKQNPSQLLRYRLLQQYMRKSQ